MHFLKDPRFQNLHFLIYIFLDHFLFEQKMVFLEKVMIGNVTLAN